MIGKLQNILKRDGFLLALANIASRLRSGIRSRFAAHALNAPGIFLGGHSIIRGARSISFGRDIHVGCGIWLEAVTEYREQRFTPTITIGDRVSFSADVHISGIDRITVGNDVLMGSRVYISDHGHGLYNGECQSSPSTPPTHRALGGGGPVHIGDNVWIGDNVVIIGPVTIGPGAVIGANSVVRKDVPPNSIAAGVPARILKQFHDARNQWLGI
ncbi:MAG: hypothetical protein MK060_15860 [Blastomonas sp.]|uniref:DapH/DapD/GlmU-related protein n=1 Tax=Blastomonas sp. TaxID=1909299 RepID=UPI00406A88EC|nr:hypothetical protein [Blastomonas sp.]